MKLPQLFAKKQPPVDYFLCLLLRDEHVGAYILQEQSGELKIVGQQEETLPNSIEQSSPEQWIEILDRVISKAEETLPPKVITHKTMFGLKESWVEEDKKINKDYLAKLKKVCEALDLQPVGFLVITEAITHQLQEQEGAPLTAILVEIGKQHLAVSHVRAGRTIETRSAMIIESPVVTVDELLKHFISATVLPARIIVFDGISSEKISQDFISHQWSKSLPFLHMPQVTALPHGFDAKAVIMGAAEQMELRLAGDIDIQTPIETTENKVSRSEKPQEQPTEVEPEKKTLAQQFNQENTQIVSADNFGFVEEQDIEQMVGQHPETEPSKNFNSDSLKNVEPAFAMDEIQREEIKQNKLDNKFSVLTNLLQISKNFGKRGQKMLTHISMPRVAGQAIPTWLYILPVVLLIIFAGIVWYVLSVQATIKITLNPKIVEEKGSITFSTNSGNDFSNNTLAAKDVSVSLDGSANTNTTGKKNVGTPAKGSVTIYNASSNSVQLDSGVTISAPNGLKFTLNSSVSVASSSGDASNPNPGTASVNVTSADLGQNYNLPSGTKFSVDNYSQSDVIAKNDNAFSGGTKQQVTVVSQNDLATLNQSLQNNLENKAKQQLQSKISGDEALLPDITNIELQNKVYSPKLNAQASTASLTATAVFHTAIYNKNDLLQLEQSLLKDKFSDNQALSDKGITTDVSNQKVVDDNTIKADIDLKAGLLPKLDNQKLINEITGKSADQAIALLAQEPQVESSDIQLSPNIPFIPKMLPRFSKNIKIETESN
ncbi:MAG TPA: baseplate J/gp47 family protein [Patescibacteria group bacterium]|nr:baseplate J/gp47 family protein [Patescibacteria group bacterium]